MTQESVDRGNMVAKECSQKRDHEKATHPFQRLHTHVLDVQSLLLVKAIGMFDPRSVPPLGVHLLSVSGGVDRNVGEQDKILVIIWVVGDHDPLHLLCVGETDLQPAQLDIDMPHLARVSKGDAELEGQRYRSCQLVQQLLFPAAGSVVVDLDPAVVRGTNNKLGVDQGHLAEDLLVIPSSIGNEAQPGFRLQRSGDANSAINLLVLTQSQRSRKKTS